MKRFRMELRPLLGSCCLLFSLVVFTIPLAQAQDVPSDDALERLLEKVDPKKNDPPKSGESPEKTKAVKPDKPAAGAKPGTGSDTAAKPKGDSQKPKDSGVPADSELDKLLEKLGETKDEPKSPESMKGRGQGEPDQKPESDAGNGADQADGSKPKSEDGLAPDKKPIDEHLEELTGIKRKKQRDKKQDPESGAMSQTVKKMREVEKRLSDEDTGDETRGKQKEIIKDFDQLIAQAKQAGGSSGSGKPQRGTQQAGNKQGNPGEKPGSTGSGTGAVMPKKPDMKSVLARSKDEWGHLPPELRGEMENVFKEDALPSRKTLIDRYYISVTRKSTGNRGE